MAATKEVFSPLKHGVDPRKGNGDGKGNWLKFEPGQAIDVVALVEVEDIIACEQCAIWMKDGNSPVWVYTGPEDPSHDLGIARSYRAFLPVIELIDGKVGETKIWGMGRTAHIALMDITEAGSELKGMELRIKRTGSGLATRYSVVPRGKRRDVSRIEEVDVIATLGPITPEGVRELITKKLGEESYEDVIEKYKGKVKGSGTSRTSVHAETLEDVPKKKAKREVEEDEDDIDDLELK